MTLQKHAAQDERGQRQRRTGRLAAGFLALFFLVSAPLAALADNATVLYYLIEMQRRVKKHCNGQSMPEAPSLIPSPALREIAARGLASGLDGASLAADAGLDGTAFLSATASGSSPQQAFDNLSAGRCAEIMGPAYHYVGAASSGGRWLILLAAEEPAPGIAPGAAPIPPAGGAPEPAGGAGQAEVPAEGDLRVPPGREREAAPAPPVEVGQMALGPDGRPVGPMLNVSEPTLPDMDPGAYEPVPPAAMDAGGYIPPAAPAEGDLRVPPNRVNEAAPAPPVVVGQMRLGPGGKAVAPIQPLEGMTPAARAGAAPGIAPAVPTSDAPAASSRTSAAPSSSMAAPAPADTPAAPASSEGRAAPPAFIPPQAPGPFGVHSPAAPSDKRADGVAPLQDTRSAKPGVLEYTAPGAATPADLAPPPPGSADPHAGAPMLALVNAARATPRHCGPEAMTQAPPLRENASLAIAARNHANDMASRRYFSSTSPEGVTLGRRVSNTGYNWAFIGENIASMKASAQAVLQSWLSSPNQCRNIMSPDFTEAALGTDPSGRYWVFTLAAPMAEDALRFE